jgi:hypothetical protein
VSATFRQLPLLLIENRGQLDPQVAYYGQGRTTTVYFTSTGVTFALSPEQAVTPDDLMKTPLPSSRERWVVKLDFRGANPGVTPQAESPQEARISYFTGPPAQWQTGLKTYTQLRYPDLWPGIDLIYTGTATRLKYHFEVKPGVDPQQIRLAYRGASSVTLTATGELDIATPVQHFQDERPVAYQDIAGRRLEVAADYALEPTAGDSQPYGFRLGPYDPTRPLLLDPAVILYAGYIGGDNYDSGDDIAVDAAGNAYVTGTTYSTQATFPVKVGPDLTNNGGDAFVAKVRADGKALVYAGYIGGSNGDGGSGIAVDGAGNAYVTGYTLSPEATFPVKGGPDLSYNGGSFDAFVAKVRADGTGLVYAGYIGGSDDEEGHGIAVDAVGNAYVTGHTRSTEATFPVKGGPDLTHNGLIDAFVAKVRADGTALVYAGYIGGSSDDYGYGGIAVDGAGNAYVAGWTASTEASFPVKGGPDLTHNGGDDAFVAKVRVDGKDLVYAGYIGGSSYDDGWGIAVDAVGNAYVTGHTLSTEVSFPVKGGPDLTHNGGELDAFVAKVRVDGKDLVYAGYIGGNSVDIGRGIALDGVGNAYVMGETDSTEASFPVKGGPDLTHNGDRDTFVAKVRVDGMGLIYAGYIGGSSNDYVYGGIAVDAAGNAYVTGQTSSTQASFPVKGGPDLTHNGGGTDAFVAKISAYPTGRNLWYLDANGNGAWDNCTSDRCYTFGLELDAPIAGDWNGDGRDEIGVKRGRYWYLDYNGNGDWNGCTADRCYTFGLAGDAVIAGDWNGDGRDEIGVKRGDTWYLDYNGNGIWNGCTTDRCYTFGLAGDAPVAGDWNGDGRDEIGVKRGNTWYLDYNGNGVWDNCLTDGCYRFGLAEDVPLAGDWDSDGGDEIGVKRGRSWYLDYNGDGVWNNCTIERCYTFGLTGDVPVTGDWGNLGFDAIGAQRVQQ